MKVLELFAGTRSIGKAFESKNHQVFSIDFDRRFEYINWYVDINDVTLESIITRFGIPDVVWASPDCTTYSVAGISHHRINDENHSGKSEYACYSDRLNRHLWLLIDQLLVINPKLLYFVENPRGMYRKMSFVNNRPRYTITYCQYGDTRMKPTDIFTNYENPNFKNPCHNGDSCHEKAPRGSRTGTQGLSKVDRSRIPHEFCKYIVRLCEEKEVSSL